MSRERYQCDWLEACEKPALLLFLLEDPREIALAAISTSLPRLIPRRSIENDDGFVSLSDPCAAMAYALELCRKARWTISDQVVTSLARCSRSKNTNIRERCADRNVAVSRVVIIRLV